MTYAVNLVETWPQFEASYPPPANRWGGGLFFSAWRTKRRVQYFHTLNGDIVMNDHIITAEHLAAYGRYLKQEEKSAATQEKYLRDITALSAGWAAAR